MQRIENNRQRAETVVSDIVYHRTGEILDRLVACYDAGPGGCRDQAAPRGVCEWVEFFAESGVRVVAVQAPDDFCGVLVEHRAAGWVCILNRCLRQQRQCAVLCHEFCEFLMSDCPTMGRGCAENFCVPLAEIRDRIANAVAAELC